MKKSKKLKDSVRLGFLIDDYNYILAKEIEKRKGYGRMSKGIEKIILNFSEDNPDTMNRILLSSNKKGERDSKKRYITVSADVAKNIESVCKSYGLTVNGFLQKYCYYIINTNLITVEQSETLELKDSKTFFVRVDKYLYNELLKNSTFANLSKSEIVFTILNFGCRIIDDNPEDMLTYFKGYQPSKNKEIVLKAKMDKKYLSYIKRRCDLIGESPQSLFQKIFYYFATNI